MSNEAVAYSSHSLLSSSPSTSSNTNTNQTGSQISTTLHAHESFTTYRHKISALATSIGLGTPTTISRLDGGSYNRIIAATLPAPLRLPPVSGAGVVESVVREVIFRIPRRSSLSSRDPITEEEEEEEEAVTDTQIEASLKVHDQVSVLRFLHHSPLSPLIPRVLAYDLTPVNQLASPYMLQARLPGVCLEEVWWDRLAFSLGDRLKLVEELVGVLAAVEGVRFEKAGRLVGASDAAGGGGAGVQVLGFLAGRSSGSGSFVQTPPTSDVWEFFRVLFQGGLFYERTLHGDATGLFASTYNHLSRIAAELAASGLLAHESVSGGVLWHWDLEPRNILVRRVAGEARGGSWEISGILDWDDAMVVAPVLARRPLVWLWEDWERGAGVEEDMVPFVDSVVDKVDLEPYDEPRDFQGRLIKARYDDLMELKVSPRWREEAYGAGRWARVLAGFASKGVDGNDQFRRFDRLKADWKVYREERMPGRRGGWRGGPALWWSGDAIRASIRGVRRSCGHLWRRIRRAPVVPGGYIRSG